MRFILLLLFTLPAFALEVPQNPVDDSVTFSWEAPSTRVNGDPLTLEEIQGYELYWSVNGGETQTVEIGVVNSYDLAGLDPGTYEAAISTVDTDGLYSQPSETVTWEINARPEPPSLFQIIKRFLSGLIDKMFGVFT